MIIATDGRTFVYGVFDADGYECKDLLGVFSSQEKAEAVASKRSFEAAKEWQEFCDSSGITHPSPRRVTVELLELDALAKDSA